MTDIAEGGCQRCGTPLVRFCWLLGRQTLSIDCPGCGTETHFDLQIANVGSCSCGRRLFTLVSRERRKEVVFSCFRCRFEMAFDFQRLLEMLFFHNPELDNIVISRGSKRVH